MTSPHANATTSDPDGGRQPVPHVVDVERDFETYRPLLFSIAYRMLGSVMGAEDAVQDAYLRYRGAASTQIHSPRAFLSTVVTRLCLDQLKSARAQRERYIGPWLPEPLLTGETAGWQAPETRIEAHESISLAFLLLLERLTPVERAVFLLHEVFDFDYDEIAAMVERRADNCRQILRRAKQRVAEPESRFPGSPEHQRRLAIAFLRAAEAGDLSSLMELLAEDITVWADAGGKVAGTPLRPIHGRDAVGRLLVGGTRRFAPAGAESVAVEVNGSPGFLVHLDGVPIAVAALEVDGDHVRAIRFVGNPDKLTHLRRAGDDTTTADAPQASEEAR